jgi:UDP-glucose 4-epimerase
MNKVLVTGGCGFIGSNLTKKLLSIGYEVDVIDNLYIGKDAKITEGCNFLNGDVRLIELPKSEYKYIFHLAALSRIQPSFEFPDLAFNVNVAGTKEVIEYAMKCNAKLVYAGSSSKHHNPELSPYAMSKYMGEQWCKLYKTVYGLNCEIARFYNVYGPGELIDSKMAAVIGIFRKQIAEGLPITIHGDGEQRRDFTHVDDIVDGLIRIAESSEIHEDAWELGTGCNYSINEVYDMFAANVYAKTMQFPEVNHVPDVPGNYRLTLRKNEDAINRLGWTPKDRLKDYLKGLNLKIK